MFEDRLSGVGNPNFGELLRRCLTLANIRLSFNIMLLVKLSRASFQVPSIVCYEIHFYIAIFGQSQNASATIHQNWRCWHHLKTPYTFITCRKWGETPYPYMTLSSTWVCLETLRITLLRSFFLESQVDATVSVLWSMFLNIACSLVWISGGGGGGSLCDLRSWDCRHSWGHRHHAHSAFPGSQLIHLLNVPIESPYTKTWNFLFFSKMYPLVGRIHSFEMIMACVMPAAEYFTVFMRWNALRVIHAFPFEEFQSW